jgi:hypothetical protein
VLDSKEVERSGFHYPYSNYQIEYSRNLIFEAGGHMDQVFQALIDRSRAPLDLQAVKTILGYKHRPRYRKRKKKSPEWEVTVERPTYDLTIFKLHCGKLTLKIYTKASVYFASRPWPTIPKHWIAADRWSSFRRSSRF